MSKPRTVTGIQVILWTLGAIAALGDLYSVVNVVDAANPATIFALVFAVYTTIQSILAPIHIARGKRWAWIWSLVSSIIGLLISLTLIFIALIDAESSLGTLAIGAVLAALYGPLFGLLCSGSARRWILVHRVRFGTAYAEPVPASTLGVPPGTVVEVERPRPATKPRAVAFTQVAMLIVALFPLSLVPLIIQEIRKEREWSHYEELTVAEHLVDQYLPLMYLMAVLLAAFLILAVVSVNGLRRGRSWVRVLIRIWIVPPAAFGTLFMFAMIFDPEDGGGWVVLMGILLGMVGVPGVAVFILTFTKGFRSWTPGSRILLAVPGGPASSKPPQPF
ncbi:hypothetical protein [Glycomyces tenuis]|uniref:hypothetical protein n=1 Tax=Glycomyces tenuis TaxID=58116 RepID=UPI00040EA778|nr:hypothetical protein [Glycomyces tenuis]